MTFNYTDKQLNNLNRDNGVYSVNSEFARRKHKKLVVSKSDSVSLLLSLTKELVLMDLF